VCVGKDALYCLRRCRFLLPPDNDLRECVRPMPIGMGRAGRTQLGKGALVQCVRVRPNSRTHSILSIGGRFGRVRPSASQIWDALNLAI
jgi:hypothetical protein